MVNGKMKKRIIAIIAILSILLIMGIIWIMDQKYIENERETIEGQVKQIIKAYEEYHICDELEQKDKVHAFYETYGTKIWSEKKKQDDMFVEQLQNSKEHDGGIHNMQASQIQILKIEKFPFIEKVNVQVEFQLEIEGQNEMVYSFGSGIYGIESKDSNKSDVNITYLLQKEDGIWKIEKIQKEIVTGE